MAVKLYCDSPYVCLEGPALGGPTLGGMASVPEEGDSAHYSLPEKEHWQCHILHSVLEAYGVRQGVCVDMSSSRLEWAQSTPR